MGLKTIKHRICFDDGKVINAYFVREWSLFQFIKDWWENVRE